MDNEFAEQVEDYAAFLREYGLGEGETETLYLEDADVVDTLTGEALNIVDVFRQTISSTYPDVIHIIVKYAGEHRHLMGEDTPYTDPETGVEHRSLAMQLMTLVNTEDVTLPVTAVIQETDTYYTWHIENEDTA